MVAKIDGQILKEITAEIAKTDREIEQMRSNIKNEAHFNRKVAEAKVI
ncbi:putative iron-regulated protein [Desulfitispora alkaliphila]